MSHRPNPTVAPAVLRRGRPGHWSEHALAVLRPPRGPDRAIHPTIHRRLPVVPARRSGHSPEYSAGSSRRRQAPARGEPRSSSPATRQKEKAADRSEPESDAAIKRKIEKQIRDTLGDRVRSVEVRVSGKQRPDRRAGHPFLAETREFAAPLETLPVLDGYRARVELGD